MSGTFAQGNARNNPRKPLCDRGGWLEPRTGCFVISLSQVRILSPAHIASQALHVFCPQGSCRNQIPTPTDIRFSLHTHFGYATSAGWLGNLIDLTPDHPARKYHMHRATVRSLSLAAGTQPAAENPMGVVSHPLTPGPGGERYSPGLMISRCPRTRVDLSGLSRIGADRRGTSDPGALRSHSWCSGAPQNNPPDSLTGSALRGERGNTRSLKLTTAAPEPIGVPPLPPAGDRKADAAVLYDNLAPGGSPLPCAQAQPTGSTRYMGASC